MLGDYYFENIELSDRRMRVRPEIVEPVCDVAVLGSLDGQEFYGEVCEYEDFCEDIPPVKICKDEYDLFKKFEVFIYTHDNGWVQAAEQLCRKNAPTLFIESEIQINGGTSGGPIVNEKGELLGIASTFSEKHEADDKSSGTIPRPHLALPAWIYQSICRPYLAPFA